MSPEYQRHRQRHFQRIRRLKRVLRPLPRRANVARYPVVRRFAALARSCPALWSFKRAHVLPALYVGSVLALLPLYGVQLALAVFAAWLVRGNLTVMAALQFVTNPLTLAPIYLATHAIGGWVLRLLGVAGDEAGWGSQVNALLVGGVVAGLLMALLIDLLWRLAAWEARRFRARLEQLRQQAVVLPAAPADPG